MPISFSERLTAWLALLAGLAISGVAVYYSVIGLTAIFAAAFVPIIIMGVTLEVSKLIATVWLKQNWRHTPFLIKTYLMAAILVLMVITSMGIFGFLSKAHLDQTVPNSEIAAKIALVDEKIRVERDSIETARKALRQLDAAVDQVLARSNDERGATNSANMRRNQQRERTQLQNDIAKAQQKIDVLNTERAPLASELRKVEAEVGPIKYIAGFFYGISDQTILEKAVTWVIITLIIVFDPLAIVLLLASQISFENFRQRKLAARQTSEPVPQYPKDDGPLTKDQIDQIKENVSMQPTEPIQVKSEIEPVKAAMVKTTATPKTKVFKRQISKEITPDTYQAISEKRAKNER